ncbi:MAG: hypothetical protein U5L45_01070 [Saprospiraceae bacterium]|nr:hypothetical protein [Saprospiraceae bacterium]
MWFIFRAKPEKLTTSPPFARAKRAQKCLLMRILNLCMVSKIWTIIFKITDNRWSHLSVLSWASCWAFRANGQAKMQAIIIKKP